MNVGYKPLFDNFVVLDKQDLWRPIRVIIGQAILSVCQECPRNLRKQMLVLELICWKKSVFLFVDAFLLSKLIC